MRTLYFFLLAALLLAYQPKPPSLEVLEASAHREGGRLNIDGRFKNTGERTAEKLVITVDVLDSDKRALTTQNGESDPESIEAGAEGEFHAQMAVPPRAVYIKLSFEDGSGREVKATKAGPFAID